MNPTTIVHRMAEGAAELLWPTRCVGCDEPEGLLCPDCAARLPWVDQRHACPVCGAPHGWLTCTECEGGWESVACVCALSFAPPASALVTVYKDGHERRLAAALAAALSGAVEEARGWGHLSAVDGGWDGLCFVPATAEALRRRGFDHMEEVARLVSRELGLPLTDVLARHPAADQRRLGRQERARNVEGTFEVLGDVSGCHLLLVDDVVTTGASCREATRALLARGAASVTIAAVARTW